MRYLLLYRKFQSTFPRGERREWQPPFVLFVVISIHVPAWGTTNTDITFQRYLHISIHVPAWGTTGAA